jgi:hypothetical protein
MTRYVQLCCRSNTLSTLNSQRECVQALTVGDGWLRSVVSDPNEANWIQLSELAKNHRICLGESRCIEIDTRDSIVIRTKARSYSLHLGGTRIRLDDSNGASIVRGWRNLQMHRVDADCAGWPGHSAGLAAIPYAIPGRLGESSNDDVLFVAPVLFADSFGMGNGIADKASRLEAPLLASLPLIAAGIAALSVLVANDGEGRYSESSARGGYDILGTAASDAAAVAAVLVSLQFILLYLRQVDGQTAGLAGATS